MLNNEIFIALGSNLGNRKATILNAIRKVNDTIGLVVKTASMIETEPWGFSSENRFLNTIISIHSIKSPMEILERLKKIEHDLGRQVTRDGEYQDRPIDLDLIDYKGLIINDFNLTLPHPRLHLRQFVLEPLAEICPNWKHPLTGQGIADLQIRITDSK